MVPFQRLLLRPALSLLAVAPFSLGWAQSPEQGVDPRTVRPDVAIVIRENNVGADIVTLTVNRGDYPVDLLRAQVQAIALGLGAPASALSVSKNQIGDRPELATVKAYFGTDNLIDRSTSRFNLQPLIGGLLGAPQGQELRSFMVLFSGVRPGPRTLRRFENAAVSLIGDELPGAVPGIEYRVVVRTQDPAELVIPTEHVTPVQSPAPAPPKGPSQAVMLGAVGFGGVLAGALVYFAVMRAPRKGRAQARPKRGR